MKKLIKKIERMRKTETILAIIKKAHKSIPMSWGFTNANSISGNEGLIFHVNGYIHKGFVKIVAQKNNVHYRVILLNDEKSEVDCIENIAAKELVSVIDKAIEVTDDYNERIKNEMNVLASMRNIGLNCIIIENPDFAKLSKSGFFK